MVKNLGSEDFKYLSGVFSGEKLNLVKKKRIYSYEYFDSFKRFKEGRLPDVVCFFFHLLKGSGISEKEYQRACDVWKVFNFKTLGDYHDLYLKTDVLLLCDVFEKLISVCLRDYGLNSSHYFLICGLSWDAMLKFTGVKLEKIHDIDVHLFLEKSLRGGVFYISKRYSKNDKNTDIMYWDINNLHGTVMNFEYLPYGDFKFLSEEEIKVFDLDSIAENSLIGYILKVIIKIKNKTC